VTLHDRGVERCGLVTFTVDGVDVYELAASLRAQGINISVSTIDFARYDFEARGLEAVARASVHYYNTEDELARLVDAVATAPRA
jgi:selenocysteine lyase/cysteine desulfurase